MPLDFPNSPISGQAWTGTNGALYIWDGTKWVLQGTSAFLQLTGGTLTGPLLYTATGAPTTRAAQDRFADQLNVKDYILPSDTDATAGFGRVMAQVQALNRPITVIVPSGTYHISAPITITLNSGMGVYLRGDGSANTFIYQTADADGIDVVINNFGSNNLMGGGFAISGLTIYQASTSGTSTTRTALSVIGGNVATGAVGVPIEIDDIYINETTGSFWAVSIYIGNLEVVFISRVQTYCRSTATTTHLVLTGNVFSNGVYSAGINVRDCFFTNGSIGIDLQGYLQGMHFYNINTVGTVISVNATPSAGINEEYQFVGCYLSGKINFVPTAINLLSAIKFVSTYFDSLTMTAANDTQVRFSNVPMVLISGCTFNGSGTRLANLTGLSITGSSTYETVIANSNFEGYQNGGIGMSFSTTGQPPLCIGNSILNTTNPIADSSSGAYFVATKINNSPYIMGAGGAGVTVPAAVTQNFEGTMSFSGNIVQTSGAFLGQSANQGVLLGSNTTSGTPYLQFYSSGHSGYDSRILAGGGTGATDGNITVYGNLLALSTINGIQLTKATVAATAPSGNNARLRFEVGTTAGTAKLVAYAGTSATGVTIADNIGTGF